MMRHQGQLLDGALHTIAGMHVDLGVLGHVLKDRLEISYSADDPSCWDECAHGVLTYLSIAFMRLP